MSKELWNLTLQGIWRRKQNSILLLIVLFLSFSFAVISLSITASMTRSSEEYRYDTYGQWEVALLDGEKSDWNTFRKMDEIGEIGTSVRYGIINGNAGIGTVDETLIKMGRLDLQQGRFPERADEIAMEADILSALGYDYELGQKITIPMEIPAVFPVEEEENSAIIEKTYTLCGVIKEYTNLWCSDQRILVGAVLSEDAANEIQAEAETLYKAASLTGPCYQYFFESAEGIKEMDGLIYNGYAYSSERKSSQLFYTGLIFLTTLVAVVCIYLTQIRGQVRQMALFRSIGITKRQLKRMLLYETLCLSIPAVILGIFGGGFGTWMLLKILTDIHSAKVYIELPWTQILFAIFLWIAGIVGIRFTIFRLALRQPLGGRIQMDTKKARTFRKWQNGLCILLATVFSATMVFSALQIYEENAAKENAESRASYTLMSISGQREQKITQECLREITRVPGIREVDAWAYEKTDLVFEGIEDCVLAQELLENPQSLLGEEAHEGLGAFVYGIRDEDVDEYLDFEELSMERSEFMDGNQVVLVFPVNADGEVLAGAKWSDEWYRDIGVRENEEITLNFYGQSIEENGSGRLIPEEESEKIGSYNIEVGAIVQVGEGMYGGKMESLAMNPYTVLCSEKTFEYMLYSLPEGYVTTFYNTSTPFAYNRAEIYTSSSAGYLSTDYVLADTCRKYGLELLNQREQQAAEIQEAMQDMIQVIACGWSISLISILILWNTLNLSAETEKKKYGILRAIGMSDKQARKEFLSKSITIGIISAISGWIFFGIYLLGYAGMKYKMFEDAIENIIKLRIDTFRIEGVDGAMIFAMTLINIFVIASVYIFSRKKVLKTDIMAMLREEV